MIPTIPIYSLIDIIRNHSYHIAILSIVLLYKIDYDFHTFDNPQHFNMNQGSGTTLYHRSYLVEQYTILPRNQTFHLNQLPSKRFRSKPTHLLLLLQQLGSKNSPLQSLNHHQTNNNLRVVKLYSTKRLILSQKKEANKNKFHNTGKCYCSQ